MLTSHCGRLFIEYWQLLSVLLQVNVARGQPFSAVASVIRVTVLNLYDELVFLPCLIGGSPAASYLAEMLWPLVMLLLLVVIATLDRLLRPSGTHSWAAVVNTGGMLLTSLFTSVTLSATMPLRCFDQPNGQRHLVAHPEIACSSDGSHAAMLGVMIVAIIAYPVGILCLCCAVIESHNRKLLLDGTFMAKYRFIFGRWHRTCYWYQLPRLLRSFIAATCTSMVNYNEPSTQILLLTFILMGSLALQLRVRPWRLQILNDIDAALAASLLVLLSIMATSTAGPPSPTLRYPCLVRSPYPPSFHAYPPTRTCPFARD